MAIWTVRPSGTIPKSAADEIAVLATFAGRLSELIDAANRQEPALTPWEVIAAISKEVDTSGETLRQIFNALENLKNLADEFGSAEQVIENITTNLKDDVVASLNKNRREIVAALEQYSSDNAVTISYKAQRLTYLRENIYQEAEVITDARPVFDGRGEKIIEYLITHSLVASYFHNGQIESIHLAMDAADVLRLRKACDRAIVKAKTLKTELGIRARILRDDDASST